MTVGLLYLEFSDSIKEGDGIRVLRCWRYMLLLFKVTGRTNYSIEVFTLLAQYHFLLSERERHQLIWGRFINIHGVPARNIPCDFFIEHLNRVAKEAVHGRRANKTKDALVRIGKAIGPLNSLQNNFDEENGINTDSGNHKTSSICNDLKKTVGVLLNEGNLKYLPGRCHKSFPNVVANPITGLDYETLLGWMYHNLNYLIHGF